jgi:hypothetical protein
VRFAGELDSTYANLQRVLIESSAMQQALELDRALSHHGPVRLSANLMSEVWEHLSYNLIRRERDRREEEGKKHSARLAQREREMSAELDALRAEVRAMVRALHELDRPRRCCRGRLSLRSHQCSPHIARVARRRPH